MGFVLNSSREPTNKGYVNVLDPETNQVMAFPQTMSKDDIDQAISDDKNGTISAPKPNWYNDKVRPVLEATGMDMFKPKFLGAKVDPDATRAFVTKYAKDASYGILENKNPEVMALNEEAAKLHPIAAWSGALAGQTQAILQTLGLGGMVGLGKVAGGAGEIALKAGAKPIVAKALEAGVANAGVGALYGAMTKGVEEVNTAIKENTSPDLVKVGHAALKDAGIFSLYGATGAAIPSKAVGTATIAGLAYTLAKVEGASETDALLSGAVMGMFHLTSSHPKEMSADLTDTLNKVKSDYIKAKNPAIHDAIADRTAEEHTMMVVEEIKASKEEANANLADGEVPVKVIATDKEVIQKTVEDMLDVQPHAQSNTEKEATSVVSYVKDGKKFYTKLTPDELKGLTDEVKNIPEPPAGESQIHLDAVTNNLKKVGQELSREDFIKGHSQASEVLREKVPEFKNTGDAETYGKKNKGNEGVIEQLSKLSDESKAIVKKMMDNYANLTPKEEQDLSNENTRGQFFREAMAIAKGERETLHDVRKKAEGKPAKAATDINKNLVSKGFDELPLEEQAKYSPITKEDQIKKVKELITKDYEKAKNMALGKEPITGDINSQVIFNAVKNKALAEMDVEALRGLADSPIATERSEAAQKLAASGFDNGMSDGDPVAAINRVKKARTEATEKKVGKERLTKEKKAEVEKIKKSIKATVKKQDWAGFIKSLEC